MTGKPDSPVSARRKAVYFRYTYLRLAFSGTERSRQPTSSVGRRRTPPDIRAKARPPPPSAPGSPSLTLAPVVTTDASSSSFLSLSCPPGLLRQCHFPDCYRGKKCLLESNLRGELLVSRRVTVSSQTARVFRFAHIFYMIGWRYRPGSSVH